MATRGGDGSPGSPYWTVCATCGQPCEPVYGASPRRSDREWTIVQLLFRDPKPVSPQYPAGFKARTEAWVVLDGLKTHAEDAVARWFAEDQSRGQNLHEVHFYPRNYVDQYRALVAAGRVIPS